MGKKLINEKEAAEKYGYSVHWFRRMRWAGGGPEYCQIGERGRVLYDDTKLSAYFESHTRKSTSYTA